MADSLVSVEESFTLGQCCAPPTPPDVCYRFHSLQSVQLKSATHIISRPWVWAQIRKKSQTVAGVQIQCDARFKSQKTIKTFLLSFASVQLSLNALIKDVILYGTELYGIVLKGIFLTLQVLFFFSIPLHLLFYSKWYNIIPYNDFELSCVVWFHFLL